MKRVLPFVLLLACSAPAFGQAVDSQGAKQLSDDLAHYFGKKLFDIGFVKISVDGDAYKLAFDFKPVTDLMAKQQAFKFDITPYFMLVKPRKDGHWDVSADVSPKGSIDFGGPEGPQHIDFSVSDNKFTGVYDPDLAAFASATGSMAGMTMTTREPKQQADVTVGPGTAVIASTKSANGGIDFTVTEKITNFAETIKVNDPKSGLSFPAAVKAPELSVDATGKGLRTKPLLDLLAFIVATDDEAKFKANEAEFKSLLTAALPLWERIDGTYGFKDFVVESPVGKFGAKQLNSAVGMDGIAKDGKINYAFKVSGLTMPQQVLPSWSVALLPTDIDLNFGGANIDLDSIAKKTIETLDFRKDPPLPADFGKQISADFLAKTPKVVLGHSTIKNGNIEIAMEGEMKFPGKKPDADVTVDITGYEKIVETLQTAAKTDPQAAQYFTGALAIKGFGKTLPDGRLEWVINTKADGSVTVNGAMLKPADPVGTDDSGEEATP
ncbi:MULTISPECIES: hypothetical protein [unclassified Mesorhizobium]|uniref:hypothetical protein n=1 Tax=unclassified Mesorhizobium TaxID=325217 RepID=UPI00333A2401